MYVKNTWVVGGRDRNCFSLFSNLNKKVGNALKIFAFDKLYEIKFLKEKHERNYLNENYRDSFIYFNRISTNWKNDRLFEDACSWKIAGLFPQVFFRGISKNSRFFFGCASTTTIPSETNEDSKFSSFSAGKGKSLEIGESGRQLMLKQKIPPNYISETLLPHLESQISEHTHYLMPSELTPLCVAYSKIPDFLRKTALIKNLSKAVKFRLDGFRGEECVKILHPFYELCSNDLDLFEQIAKHMSQNHIFSSLTTLNLISVLRVYAKIIHKHYKSQRVSVLTASLTSSSGKNFFIQFVDQVLSRLKKELENYDSFELTDILSSIALQCDNSGTYKDIYLLGILLPLLEKKYYETSLLHSINNVKSLCVLNIYHENLINMLINDISNSHRIRNLPHKYVAILTWTFYKYKIFHKISSFMLPLIEQNINKFDCKGFSRLAQSMPVNSNAPDRVCANILPKLKTFSHNEFLLFFLGCVYRELFPCKIKNEEKSDKMQKIDPLENESYADAKIESELEKNVVVSIDKEKLLENCLSYIKVNEEKFTNDSINKIVFLLKHNESYLYIISLLPISWNEYVQNCMNKCDHVHH